MNHAKKSFIRGMALAEVVIALTVITIVSMVGITMSTKAMNVSAKSLTHSDVRRIADNALECFKYCDDIGTFKTEFEKTLRDCDKGEGDYNIKEYTVDSGKYTIKDQLCTLEISVTDNTFNAIWWDINGYKNKHHIIFTKR